MDTDCFLCDPDAERVIYSDDRLRLVAGLGPLTNAYVVIAATEHVRCFADYVRSHPECVHAIENVQRWLAEVEGAMLLTEHGRVPMCTSDEPEETPAKASDHDSHCYHAHFLAFATAKSITAELSSYFMENVSFGNLEEALAHAATVESYILSAPTIDEIYIHSSPIHMPRQLTRTLVAQGIGTPELGNWRVHQGYEQACATASRLRAALPASFSRSAPAELG